MKDKHYLTPLLEPRSVGIIGASEREAALGNVLMRNMLEAGYKGKLSETTTVEGSLEVLANVNGQTINTREVSPFEDLRVNLGGSLSAKLTASVALSFSITAKFDNVPAPLALAGFTLDPTDPPEASRIDTTTKASLIITLL